MASDAKPKDDSAEAAVKTEQAPPPPATTDCDNRFWTFLILGVVLTAIVIGLSVGLSRREPAPEEEDVPIAVDFSTGVSLVTYYGIETVVRSRLARTIVSVDVANALDCTSIHSITLQLPRDARITNLETFTEDGCISRGDVQELKQARETFLETAAEGLPGAYIEEQDSFTHGLQVAMSPLSTTRVELVIEELLQQRLGEVEFQMPLAPNEVIDQIVFDLTVQDLNQGPVEFHLDLPNEILDLNRYDGRQASPIDVADANNDTDANNTEQEGSPAPLISRFRLDIADAREYDLPGVLRGWFQPSEIDERGVLATDGQCFEHYFLPPGEPLPRNLVLLLDTTGSDEYVFDDIKSGLKEFINTLKPQDFLSIQTYSEEGSLDLWGPSSMSEEDKEDARKFINDIGGREYDDADLQEAFLEALLRAKRNAKTFSDNTANILVALSANSPSSGERDRAKIATNIYKLNEDGEIKIYTIGFPGRMTDLELLDAIALVNGGVSASIVYGSTNYTSQLLTFLENEIGSILLADVEVEVLPGEGAEIYGETQHIFPLLAHGSEVVVRGLIETDDDGTGARELQAVTTADTVFGRKNWTVNAAHDFYSSADMVTEASLCFQSYAHERITQLLRLRDASKFMEHHIVSSLVDLADKTCDTKKKLPECLEKEALNLALRANVVVKGLTAMVTVDDENCLSFEEETEVCLDGTTPDSVHTDAAEYHGDGGSESEGGGFHLVFSMFHVLFSLCVALLIYSF